VVDKRRVNGLAKDPQSRDESLEALDFIVNVLKEHEKDLDRLINELATVTEQLGDTGELSGKVEKVEEKITSLQKEVTNLMSYISSVGSRETPPTAAEEQSTETTLVPTPVASSVAPAGPSVILRCKQWEDFQALAFRAQTLSFAYKEDEKIFQADALKGNQIITYSGALPKVSSILKTWLSKELGIPERNVLEGGLAIG
jgi:seryl-tRNA synthetase